MPIPRTASLGSLQAEDTAKDPAVRACWEEELFAIHHARTNRGWQGWQAKISKLREETLVSSITLGTKLAEGIATEAAVQAGWDAEHRGWQKKIAQIRRDVAQHAVCLGTKLAEDFAKESAVLASWNDEHQAWQTKLASMRPLPMLAEDFAKQSAVLASWNDEHQAWQTKIATMRPLPMLAEDFAKQSAVLDSWNAEHRAWQTKIASMRETTLAHAATVGTAMAEEIAKEAAVQAGWDAEHLAWQTKIDGLRIEVLDELDPLSASPPAAESVFTPPDAPLSAGGKPTRMGGDPFTFGNLPPGTPSTDSCPPEKDEATRARDVLRKVGWQPDREAADLRWAAAGGAKLSPREKAAGREGCAPKTPAPPTSGRVLS
jgi:hypothetical protein